MRSIICTAAALLCATTAFAQSSPVDVYVAPPPSRQPQTIGETREITIKTTLDPTPAVMACQSQLDMSWYQKNTDVIVESEITNEHCGPSYGTYIVEVRYRDEDQESRTREFPETWERADDQPIDIRKEYFVDENVDVLRVRTRKLRCKCKPAEVAEEKPAVEPPASD